MRALLGLARADLAAQFPDVARHHVDALYEYMYRAGARELAGMQYLPETLRAAIAQTHQVGRLQPVKSHSSADGTTKWLLAARSQHKIETVLIPERARATVCVSSQVGCSLSCAFCHTGTQKFGKNLDAGEIVSQVLEAMQHAGDFPLKQMKPRRVTNVVFMGQGEPLYNLRNVAAAVSILTAPPLSFSKSRIVVSTSGVAPAIPKLAPLGASLAISLHAVRDDLRDTLVPLNKQYPLTDVLAACRAYIAALPTRTNRRVTFEYVMLRGVNDALADARELDRMLAQLPAHVNLIPFNKWPGAIFEPSSPDAIDAFARELRRTPCTVRRPRGDDILAACGQLRSSDALKARAAMAV